MKKSILFLATSLSLIIACKDSNKQSSTEKENFVSLSGKIKLDNKENADVYLLIDPNALETKPIKKLFLNKDGSFKDTINNIKEGYYVLTNDASRSVNLYLKQGDSLKITTDATAEKNFLDSLSVKGNIESQFLTDYEKFKSKNFTADTETFFKLGEKEFKQKLDSLRANSLNFVKNYKGINEKIRKTATLEINYGWGLVLNSYPLAHAQITQNAQYKPSANFYDYTKELSINDVNLFKSNAKYRAYVSQELNRLMNTEVKPKPNDDLLTIVLNYYNSKNINPFIKDYMLYQVAMQGVQRIPIFEEYAQMVNQNIQQQLAAYKQQYPNQPLPPLPTADDIRKEYTQFATQQRQSNEKINKKIVENVKTPEIKKLIFTNYQVIMGLKRGDVAPVITVQEASGEMVDLIKEYSGKNLIICIWNPVTHENNKKYLTEFSNLAQNFKEKDAVFITINIDFLNKKRQWEKIIKDDKITTKNYLAPFDYDSDFVKPYSIETHPIPRFILIDKTGKIYNFNAPSSLDIQLKNDITALLN